MKSGVTKLDICNRPSISYFMVSLDKAFYKMGRLEDARKALEMAKKRNLDNGAIQLFIEKLKRDLEKSKT